jgi:hypothetical protein
MVYDRPMRNFATALILGLALAGCGGGSSNGGQQQQGNHPCGTVSGTVNGSIIDSAGGGCQVTWQTADLGTMRYGITTARSLDSDNMSFSNLSIVLAAGGPPVLGTFDLTGAADSSIVALDVTAVQDEQLVAEKAGNILVGSVAINVSSIEPSDGVSSVVHGTMTAHLGVPPGAPYSGNADVDMTF